MARYGKRPAPPEPGHRDNFKHFTERALEAQELQKLVPPVVYLPRRIRSKMARLTVDDLSLTVDPPSVAENHVRIRAADPVGFLIAIMNGQPIPTFEIGAQGALTIKYEYGTLDDRERIAKFLAHKVTIPTTKQDGRTGMILRGEEGDFDAMIRSRADAVDKQAEKEEL